MFDVSDPNSLADFINKSKIPLDVDEQNLINKAKVPGVNLLSVYELYELTVLAWQAKGYLRCIILK